MAKYINNPENDKIIISIDSTAIGKIEIDEIGTWLTSDDNRILIGGDLYEALIRLAAINEIQSIVVPMRDRRIRYSRQEIGIKITGFVVEA